MSLEPENVDPTTRTAPTYAAVGHTFIDDIVFPNGKTNMAVLGGGGVHAAAGMRVWDERPGIVAAAGYDMPRDARWRLQAEFDTDGITWLEVPQLRGWQLFEVDNRRTEVLRMVPQSLFEDNPTPQMFPQTYASSVRAMTILNTGNGFLRWRKHFPDKLLLWEPNQEYMVSNNLDEFRKALPNADIVSPNLEEARAMYGIDQPSDLIRLMFDDGAQIVALRMGEAGSLVGDRRAPELLYVPPIPVSKIVDQTGAGNAYCGGFVVGWHQTQDLIKASCYGAVSASFALENIGPIKVDERTEPQRDKRYRWLKSRIEVEPVIQ